VPTQMVSVLDTSPLLIPLRRAPFSRYGQMIRVPAGRGWLRACGSAPTVTAKGLIPMRRCRRWREPGVNTKGIAMSARPAIEVDEMNVRYGEFHAGRDLSFQVERGRLYPLLCTNEAARPRRSRPSRATGRRQRARGASSARATRTGERCVPGWGSCCRRAGSQPAHPCRPPAEPLPQVAQSHRRW
jgi:hypothetical protein